MIKLIKNTPKSSLVIGETTHVLSLLFFK